MVNPPQDCDPNLVRILVEELEDHAIFTLDREGRVATWNGGAERCWGYREEEILGQHLSRFYAPQEVALQLASEQLRRAVASGRSEHEGRRCRKDGSRFVSNMVISVLRDDAGGVYGFACITRDVTGRRMAEMALRESESRFHAFMDNSLAVNFVADAQGRLRYVDQTFERRFGIPASACLGATMFDLWPADFARPLHETCLQVLASNEPCELIEKMLTPQGETLWLVCKFPFTDRMGERFVGATALDVTEHERTKQELEKLNAELERRVSERTAELQSTNEELKAFSYSVSHDLRAPLRAIDGFSQALVDDYANRLDAAGLDFLERVRAEAQRMGQLMDDLLKLFRVSRTELHRSPVDLSAIAREVGEELMRQAPHRQVEFVVRDGLLAHGDTSLLRLVLENLLENAWKFTSKRDRARIEFGADLLQDGQTVWFVKDNGVGFDMAYADRLFGAFQRLHADTDFAGTGIGLATVQRVVHRHGGEVGVEAAVDKGATFFFTL